MQTARMTPDPITATLALMKRDDLYPSWRIIHLQEQHGKISAAEAERWKDGIYTLMQRWRLEPDHLT